MTYRNDNDAAFARVEALEREKAELAREKRDLARENARLVLENDRLARTNVAMRERPAVEPVAVEKRAELQKDIGVFGRAALAFYAICFIAIVVIEFANR